MTRMRGEWEWGCHDALVAFRVEVLAFLCQVKDVSKTDITRAMTHRCDLCGLHFRLECLKQSCMLAGCERYLEGIGEPLVDKY